MIEPNKNNPIEHLVCSACSARNMPDSVFCDQCSEPLFKIHRDSLDSANDDHRNSKRPYFAHSPGRVTLIVGTVFAFLYLLIFVNSWFSARRLAAQDARWISLANSIDAEAIVGRAVPKCCSLIDIKSFEDMHSISLVNLKSGQMICVISSNDGKDVSVNDMNTAWNSYVRKITRDRDPKLQIRIKNLDPVKIIGRRKLALQSGKTSAELIVVPLLSGSAAEGMQTKLAENGKIVNVAAYEADHQDPFSETAFVEFLNEWQADALKGQSSTLSLPEMSIAYTKRGEYREKFIVRQPEALLDFQKAIKLDANNVQAQSDLRALINTLHTKETASLNEKS